MDTRLSWLAAIAFITGCAATIETGDRYCRSALFSIDARFEGGDLDACHFETADSAIMTLLPEDAEVSDAFSWFAFRVAAQRPQDEIRIELRFPGSYARFWPKVSDDGQAWSPAAEHLVDRSADGKTMWISVQAKANGTWVAAQELVTLPYYEQWLADLGAHAEIETDVIGTSAQGRPIHLARSADRPEAIILLGRQHPAEVPGAFAMRRFVDVVLGDSELARAFRERFMLLIVPLVNPDGVVNGHSRHNLGATDLNRDWGPFTQPETQAVAKLLDGLEAKQIRPRLMFDFHATRMTPTMIFYTQVPEDNTDPPLFATRWLTRVDERIDDYEFTHDPRTPLDNNNTKNYFFARYGIPALTYEIGDEADRDLVQRYTPVFAEEMMRVMLEATTL